MAQRQRPMMAGGYRPADTKTAKVLQAATFAVDTISQESATSKYTFAAELAMKSRDSTPMEVKVVRASQQVVAGMNYKVTIALFEPNTKECAGGFEATIYDHFGDLSVTSWGKEHSCDKIKDIMETS